ncbi:MAG: glycosyltransferase [Flavobacteriales bacterium]|jgi:hypothetical protein|nr:glycosyltransferase [Flavobacteriales bacterium]
MGAREPLVSIVCITFNHAAFIRRALDGFVAQRSDFPFEVIVHDDASSDATAAIVREYAERHPEMIVPVLQTENQYSQGRKPWAICFPMARGQYIALCEGDDHWTDPLKLQKQVDALEADPQAVGCFTDAWNERDGVRTSYMDGIYAARPRHRLLRQRDMVLGQNIPACTVVFRSDDFRPVPEILSRSPVGDTVLYAHITRKGHLIYLQEHTAVRTMHAGGVHSLKAAAQKLAISRGVYPVLDELTNGRYRAGIARILADVDMRLEILRAEQEKGADGLHALLYDVDRNRRKEAGYVKERRDALAAALARLGMAVTPDEAEALLLLYSMRLRPPDAARVRVLHRTIARLEEADRRCALVKPEVLHEGLRYRWDACFHGIADQDTRAGLTHLLLSRDRRPARWRYLLTTAWRRRS